MSLFPLIPLFRPSYWTKNLLLFLPLIWIPKIFIPENFLFLGLKGFLLFSLAASTGYIFNDIIDRSSDRLSVRRSNRKLADKSISVPAAVSLLVFLFLLQSIIWFSTPLPVVLVLWVYLLLSFLYTLYFKHTRWLDVGLLSAFHTLRIVFGFVLFGLPFDTWMIGASFLGFLTLALVKRLDELAGDPVHARPYNIDQTKLLARLAMATSVGLGVLLLTYVISSSGKKTFSAPMLLLLLIPLFSAWIASWMKAALQGRIKNPVVFFFSQSSTYLLIAGAILILKGAN